MTIRQVPLVVRLRTSVGYDVYPSMSEAANEIERLQAALDSARHKSEDYELRAKAAEATLARVRASVEDDWFIRGDDWFEGYGSAQLRIRNIIDGKTK